MIFVAVSILNSKKIYDQTYIFALETLILEIIVFGALIVDLCKDKISLVSNQDFGSFRENKYFEN